MSGVATSDEHSRASTPLRRNASGKRPVVPAGRAANRFSTTVDWIVRVLAIAIVVLLVVFANLARPVEFADVTPQTAPSLYLGPFAVTGGGHVDHGSVPLQVTGILTEAGSFVAELELETRPSGEFVWQKQSACCTLLGSAFTGSASLSVASAQTFDFQLVSVGDDTVLATGTLTVYLESFPGGSQLAINIIAGLGLIAVALEFLRFVFRPRTTPEPAPSTKQGEFNASKQ
jgi:hypothetical protein